MDRFPLIESLVNLTGDCALMYEDFFTEKNQQEIEIIELIVFDLWTG